MRRIFFPLALLLALAAGALIASGVSALVVFAAAGVLVVFIAAAPLSIYRVAYFAVCVFVLTVTWNGIRLGGGAAADGFFAIATVAVLAWVVRERIPVPVPGWLFAAALGFAATALIVLLFPPDATLINASLIGQRQTLSLVNATGELTRASDLLALLKILLALLWIPVMLATVATTNARVFRLMDLWTISGCVNASVALLQYVGVPIGTVVAASGRVEGLTLHPNYLALTCVMAIPTAFVWVTRTGRWRIAGIAAVALLAGGELVSGSRAGAVAGILAVVVPVAAIPRLRRALPVLIPLAGMAIVAVLLFTNVESGIVEQTRLGGYDPTAQASDRVRAIGRDNAIDQFEARPISGIGLASIEEAHNIYLQLLAAGGALAAVSFITFLVGLFGSARHIRAGPARDAAIAAGISILVWLANGVFGNQLADKFLYVVPGLLLALSRIAVSSAPLEAPLEPEPNLRTRDLRSPVRSPSGAL
jgi:O-antigen ligase